MQTNGAFIIVLAFIRSSINIETNTDTSGREVEFEVDVKGGHKRSYNSKYFCLACL